MMLGSIAGKAACRVRTGLAGAAAYDGAKKVLGVVVAHEAVVAVVALGLRGVRAAETGADKARLATADILGEAREKIGEQAPPPGVGAGEHYHEH
jgi:hypothetical protein